MSNSPLVDYVKISPNSSNPRNKPITKITIHHMAGNLSVERCGDEFAAASRKASSNYGIDTAGRVGMYVEEENRSWCSSNKDNDNRAITIEVANDEIGGNWHVSNKALTKLIELCVDICKRNGIKELKFTGDKSGNLTMHKYFAATACPGAYLESKFPYIAEQVNKQLKSKNNKTTINKTEEACTVELPVLKKGSKGKAVKALQILLIGNGYNCGSAGADGDYGNSTYNAVTKFQKANKLTVDGVAGANTWSKLLK